MGRRFSGESLSKAFQDCKVRLGWEKMGLSCPTHSCRIGWCILGGGHCSHAPPMLPVAPRLLGEKSAIVDLYRVYGKKITSSFPSALLVSFSGNPSLNFSTHVDATGLFEF